LNPTDKIKIDNIIEFLFIYQKGKLWLLCQFGQTNGKISKTLFSSQEKRQKGAI